MRYSVRQRKRALRFAVLGNAVPIAVATATDFSSHHTVFFIGAVGGCLAPVGVTLLSRRQSDLLLRRRLRGHSGPDHAPGLQRRRRLPVRRS